MRPTLTRVTDETFDSEVLASDLPVILMYWIGWWGPCVGMANALQTLAPAYTGHVKMLYVDVEKEDSSLISKTAHWRGIEDLPITVFYLDGQEKARLDGDYDANEMSDEIATLLGVPAGGWRALYPLTTDETPVAGDDSDILITLDNGDEFVGRPWSVTQGPQGLVVRLFVQKTRPAGAGWKPTCSKLTCPGEFRVWKQAEQPGSVRLAPSPMTAETLDDDNREPAPDRQEV